MKNSFFSPEMLKNDPASNWKAILTLENGFLHVLLQKRCQSKLLFSGGYVAMGSLNTKIMKKGFESSLV